MLKQNKFSIQNNQYIRPYHHLVSFDDKKIHDNLEWGLEYYGYVDSVLSLFGKYNKGKHVADVGCGDGKVAVELAKRTPEVSFVGFDLSKHAILFAQAYGYGLDNLTFHHDEFGSSGGGRFF